MMILGGGAWVAMGGRGSCFALAPLFTAATDNTRRWANLALPLPQRARLARGRPLHGVRRSLLRRRRSKRVPNPVVTHNCVLGRRTWILRFYRVKVCQRVRLHVQQDLNNNMTVTKIIRCQRRHPPHRLFAILDPCVPIVVSATHKCQLLLLHVRHGAAKSRTSST